MSADKNEMIKKLYDAFNARKIDVILKHMHPNVKWPNGMEGGFVHGHAAVRDYWTRQWKLIDPHVEPLKISTRGRHETTVEVRQIVKDLAGKVVVDKIVLQVYTVYDDLIMAMEIRTP